MSGTCPQCGDAGKIDRKGRGQASCATCGGAFVPLPTAFAALKRAGVDGARLSGALAQGGKAKRCVTCNDMFTTFPIVGETMHACVPCQAVWVAKGSLDRIAQQGTANASPLGPKTMVMMASAIDPGALPPSPSPSPPSAAAAPPSAPKPPSSAPPVAPATGSGTLLSTPAFKAPPAAAAAAAPPAAAAPTPSAPAARPSPPSPSPSPSTSPSTSQSSSASWAASISTVGAFPTPAAPPPSFLAEVTDPRMSLAGMPSPAAMPPATLAPAPSPPPRALAMELDPPIPPSPAAPPSSSASLAIADAIAAAATPAPAPPTGPLGSSSTLLAAAIAAAAPPTPPAIAAKPAGPGAASPAAGAPGFGNAPTSKPFNITSGPPPAAPGGALDPAFPAPPKTLIEFPIPGKSASGPSAPSPASPPGGGAPLPSLASPALSPTGVSGSALDPDVKKPGGSGGATGLTTTGSGASTSSAAAAAANSLDPDAKRPGEGKAERKKPAPDKKKKEAKEGKPEGAGGGLVYAENPRSSLPTILLLLVLVGAGAFGASRFLGGTPSTALGGGRGVAFWKGSVELTPVSIGTRAVTKFSSAKGDELEVAYFVPGGVGAESPDMLIIQLFGEKVLIDGAPRSMGGVSVMNADVTMADGKRGRVRAYYDNNNAWVLGVFSADGTFSSSREATRFMSSLEDI